jgi:hypothetical protein
MSDIIPNHAAGGTQSLHYSLHVLPDELILEIARVLENDNTSLSALSRSCRRLKAIAGNLLYSSILLPRGSDLQAAYLVRTLLEKPENAKKIVNLSISIAANDFPGSPELIDLANQPTWVADMTALLGDLDSRYDRWRWQIEAGVLVKIAALLLILLPSLVNLDISVYLYEKLTTPVHALHSLFGTGDYIGDNFQSKFIHLGQVKKLCTLGNNMGILQLPFTSLTCLKVDLVTDVYFRDHTGTSRQSFINAFNPEDAVGPVQYGKLTKIVVLSDWAELRPNDTDVPCLTLLLSFINSPQLCELEVWIKRSPRYCSGGDADFQNLVENINAVAAQLETHKIDYEENATFDSKILGRFGRASSLTSFSRLRKLVVLQQVLMSGIWRHVRTVDWERNLAAFLPPTLESLTIVCPTETALDWLEHLQATSSLVSNLRNIVLLCRCGHGAPPSDFQDERVDQLFNRLFGLGIAMTVEEETPGAFLAQAREMGSVWEANWAEEGWADMMYGVEGLQGRDGARPWSTLR